MGAERLVGGVKRRVEGVDRLVGGVERLAFLKLAVARCCSEAFTFYRKSVVITVCDPAIHHE